MCSTSCRHLPSWNSEQQAGDSVLVPCMETNLLNSLNLNGESDACLQTAPMSPCRCWHGVLVAPKQPPWARQLHCGTPQHPKKSAVLSLTPSPAPPLVPSD